MAKADKSKKNVVEIDFEGVEGRWTAPEGDYRVKPVSVTKEEGNEFDYLSWKFEVTSEDGEGKNLFTNTSLSPKALWNLRGLLEVMGVEIPDGMLKLDLIALLEEAEEFMVTVEHEKYEGKTQARIVDYFQADAEESEPEEETKPAGKKDKKDKKSAADDKKKPKEEAEEAPDFDELDKDELVEFIDNQDLDVDPDDFPKLSKLRAAVEKAYTAKVEAGGGDDSGDEDTKYTEDAINDMGTKDLQAIVDKHDLGIELDGSTKTKRRAVIKALKKKELLED